MMRKIKNMTETKTNHSISFVIPCYNEEKYIEACVTSIRNDASKLNIPYEIIIVDNNSTDQTYDIAASLGVRVIRETRKGVVFARQTGYENAKHNLIANIDADSTIPSGWTSTALRNIDKDDVVAVTGPLIYTDGSRSLRFATRFYYYLAWLSIHLVGVFLQGGNCMIKKSCLDEMNGYDTTIAFYGEDTMTGKRLSEFGKVKLVMSLNLHSSARRLHSQGVLKTTWLYLVNYLYVTFKSKPHTNEYKDFR